MTGYKIERLLIIGVLALTLLIEIEFQFGMRDFIANETQGYLDVYCWNKIYGSGATRDIVDNKTGWSVAKNFTKAAENNPIYRLNFSLCPPCEVKP